MKITVLKYISNYIKTSINWSCRQINKVWDLIVQVPHNILTIFNILLVIGALLLSIQNAKVSSRFQKGVVENLTQLKSTQARWEEEISRRPQLSLLADSTSLISKDTLFVHFELLNTGNQIGKVSGIIYYVPANYKFISDNWILSASDKLTNQYSLDQIPLSPFSPKTTEPPAISNKYFRFKLIKPINSKFPLSVSYEIYEEKTGSQKGELKLPVSEFNAR